jgi:hypothetical protein
MTIPIRIVAAVIRDDNERVLLVRKRDTTKTRDCVLPLVRADAGVGRRS